MPTSYTAPVKDGEITEFKDFAKRCARAFGALISIRDEPLSSDIPERLITPDYYYDNLTKAQRELRKFERMTDKELDQIRHDEHKSNLKQHFERQKEEQRTKKRYDDMLEKARAWKPPTEDHKELKSFMIEQLNESKKFDCGYYDNKPPPNLKPFDEWKQDRLKTLTDNVNRQIKSLEEEQERVRNRNKWIKVFLESLDETPLDES